MMERDSAQEYVQNLYRFVLGRSPSSGTELDNWTNLLLSGHDPIEVFNLFSNSLENRKRLELLEFSKTKYPNGHFYSPVVDTREVEAAENSIFSDHTPACLNLNSKIQLELFSCISQNFLKIPFLEKKNKVYRYYYNNTSYGFGDACIYWGILAHYKPNKVVEVGSGFTSALLLDCIEYLNLSTSCTFVDPYPDLLYQAAAPIGMRHKVIVDKVQNLDLKIIDSLEKDDILFIDSSHVVKTGSDVCFELTKILPRLKSGTIVHFHDIFFPFEYPKKWVREDNLSWNEIYYLQAFLMYNNDFEIIFFNDYFRKMHSAEVEALPSTFAERIMLNPGGGLWLRRV